MNCEYLLCKAIQRCFKKDLVHFIFGNANISSCCNTPEKVVLGKRPQETFWCSASCFPIKCTSKRCIPRNTKVLNAIQNDNEERIRHDLKSQGFIITSILLHASSKTRDLWSMVQKNMPKNIFNFTIKYLNNTLATRKNLCKWSLSSTSACSFCFQSETLQHIVSSCKSYLEDGRYTWRHNSVFLHLANSLSSFKNTSLFADLPSFPSPSLVTGDSLRPDLVLILNNTSVYLLELTVGFESNIAMNSDRKLAKYRPLFNSLRSNYTSIHYRKYCQKTLISVGNSLLNMIGYCNSSLVWIRDPS